MKTLKPQCRAHQQRQGDEQGCSRMANRAGMLPVSAWIDDLERMQRWVADLYKQQREAEACDKQIASPANECKRPGNSQPSLKSPTSSDE
jgi:hypothetical protein